MFNKTTPSHYFVATIEQAQSRLRSMSSNWPPTKKTRSSTNWIQDKALTKFLLSIHRQQIPIYSHPPWYLSDTSTADYDANTLPIRITYNPIYRRVWAFSAEMPLTSSNWKLNFKIKVALFYRQVLKLFRGHAAKVLLATIMYSKIITLKRAQQ